MVAMIRGVKQQAGPLPAGTALRVGRLQGASALKGNLADAQELCRAWCPFGFRSLHESKPLRASEARDTSRDAHQTTRQPCMSGESLSKYFRTSAIFSLN